MTSIQQGQAGQKLLGAIVSTDADLAEALKAILSRGHPAVAVGMVVDVPFTDIDNERLEALRELDADVIFLDLEHNAHVGLKLAGFLLEHGIGRSLIAVGPTDSPELLLQAMQAGVSEYLPKPADAADVKAAVDRLWRRSGRAGAEQRRDPGTILPVFSAKGGTGSTTVATNLAVEVARLTRKRTLLVDLDLELGETALLLGMEPRFSIVDLLRNFHRVDSDLLASYIETHDSGLELLSAPFQPADFESVSGERVQRVLEFLRSHYDYVVVDCPKTLNPATIAAFRGAEALYLVATADLPALRNLTRCLPLLRGFAPKRPEDWMRVLVNRFDPGDVITPAEVEKTVQLKVYATLSNDYRAVMESINQGRPVVSQSKSRFAADVRSVASKITGVPVEDESGGGFFGSLFSRRNGGARETSARSKPAPPKKVTTHE